MSELDELKPIYFPTECRLDHDLFLPIAKVASSIDCMVGYFTSGSLSELALSFATYLASPQSMPMRFIVSPNLTGEDICAIQEAVQSNENLLPLLFPGFNLDERSLRTEAVRALSYLIASGKLTLKIALKKDGLFHTKCWLFDTPEGEIAVHGSGNATTSGLAINFEQIVVSRSWMGVDSKFICQDLRRRFDTIWDNSYEGIICTELTEATLESLSNIRTEVEDTEDGNKKLQQQLIGLLNEMPEEHIDRRAISKLSIPEWLNYQTGEYAHQGLAVQAWSNNSGRGILSIATGGGKTLTSLIAATVTNQRESLFVVVAVPTNALLNQWAQDVEAFGVKPINSYGVSRDSIKRTIKAAARNLRHGSSQAEVIIITHDALKSDFLELFEDLSTRVSTMLIGDEVHNLGAVGFQAVSPSFFKYRLGLSATHERQFDDEGTEFLIEYFGKVVFDYPLDKAIGVCLVPFDYYVHEVYLTAEEEDQIVDITRKIRRLSYAANNEDGDISKVQYEKLCIKRRRLIESASNKIKVFGEVFPSKKEDVQRTLIFCTDKYPDQLNEINDVLNSRSINFHQVTGDETAQPKLLDNVVQSFVNGDLQALTSKRVLDEGFNVPQTEYAYIIASHTGRRQWIQRLGRVLRLSPKTNKTKAVIHDFMVIPVVNEGGVDEDLKSLVKTEYDRLSFFSNLSKNGLEEGGAFFKIRKLLDLLRKT